VLRTTVVSHGLALSLLAAVALFSSTTVTAQPMQLRAGPSLLHHVAIIDEDSRQTEAEYARKTGQPLAAVQKRFAATGQVRCADGSRLSGQLTGKADVVTTAAHGFYDFRSCKIGTRDYSSCTFNAKIRGKQITRRIKSVEATGYDHCVGDPIEGDDWAVVKLDRAIPDIVPYDVNPFGLVYKNETLLSLSAGAINFFRPGVSKQVSTNTNY
jgi:hypothetical protein